MKYADYDFYCNDYCGSKIKTAEEFNRMAVEASAYLNQITLGRIETPSDEVKMATCAIADVYFNQYKAENEKEVASESVGPHSVSYVKKSKTMIDYQKEKREKAMIYLSNTGLLYRGVSSGIY